MFQDFKQHFLEIKQGVLQVTAVGYRTVKTETSTVSTQCVKNTSLTYLLHAEKCIFSASSPIQVDLCFKYVNGPNKDLPQKNSLRRLDSQYLTA